MKCSYMIIRERRSLLDWLLRREMPKVVRNGMVDASTIIVGAPAGSTWRLLAFHPLAKAKKGDVMLIDHPAGQFRFIFCGREDHPPMYAWRQQ